MDFKLHQLSGSNIESIFNKAYLDAKLVDKDWCSIKGELEILIKAFEDLEIISFYHECSLTKELSEEEKVRLLEKVKTVSSRENFQ